MKPHLSAVAAHLRATPGGQTLAEVSAALGITHLAAFARLRNMIAAGHVMRHGKLKRDVVVYTLAGDALTREVVRVHAARSYSTHVPRVVAALADGSRTSPELGVSRRLLARMAREGIVVRMGEGPDARFRLPGRAWKAPMREWA